MSLAWRLIEDGPGSGGWNMGVDEALLASAVAGRATLRLYSWDGPWLSLGYGQPSRGDLRSACLEAGVGMVRRVTGGRAVLHGSDLTYAIAAPEEAQEFRLVSAAGDFQEYRLPWEAVVGLAEVSEVEEEVFWEGDGWGKCTLDWLALA